MDFARACSRCLSRWPESSVRPLFTGACFQSLRAALSGSTPAVRHHARSSLARLRAVMGATQRYSEFVAPLAAERPRLCVAKMRAPDGLPVLKSGFCVSTVSIVCGRVSGSMAVVSGCNYWTGRRLARPMNVIVIADDADGADGVFRPRMDPDYPGSSSPFTAEGNVDA
jgi:hypothetical protein